MLGSEIVDVAMRLFQALGWSLLRVSLGPCLFCLAVIAFVSAYALPNLVQTSNANSMTTQIGEASLGVALSLFVGGPLFVIGLCTAAAGVTTLVSDYMLGNVPDERAAQAATLRVLPKLIGLAFRDILSLSIGMVLSTALLIVSALLSKNPNSADLSGIIFAVAIISFLPSIGIFLYLLSIRGLGPAVTVLEGAGAREAAKRSKYLLLTPDRRGAGNGTMFSLFFTAAFMLFALLLGFYGIASLLDLRESIHTAARQLPFAPLWVDAFDMAPMFFCLWLIVPFIATTTTILYYDRRIRLEGYDIEALAGDVWRADKASRFQL